MHNISFEMLYQKALKNLSSNDIKNNNLYCKYKMNENEQIEYLKQLGNIKNDKESYKIHIYNRIIKNINYCVYMIKIPTIKEKNQNGIKIDVEYLYRTCIMAVNSSNDGDRVLDNILLYQDSDFDKVEKKWNELYKIISEKAEEEILKIINNTLCDNTSKN